MKINSINSLKLAGLTKQNKTKKENNSVNYNVNSYNPLPLSNPISFKGSGKTAADIKKERTILNSLTPESQEIYEKAKMLAKISHTRNIESWQLFLASLISIRDYLSDIDDGIIQHEKESGFYSIQSLQQNSTTSDSAIENEKSRKKIEEVLDKHIDKMRAEFLEPSKQENKMQILEPTLSKEAVNELWEIYNEFSEEYKIKDSVDSMFFLAVKLVRDRKTNKEGKEFFYDMQKALGVQRNDKQKSHLAFYDDNADKIWKNISMGNDVIVTYDMDNRASNEHLVSSFVNLINKPGQEYKNVNPDNVNVVVLNDYFTTEFFEDLVEKAKKDKSKKTVIVLDYMSLVKGCDTSTGAAMIEQETLEAMANMSHGQKSQNVRVVMLMPSTSYIANVQVKNIFADVLNSYNRISLPVLNAQDAKKYLTDKKGVEYVKNAVKKEIPKETIERAVELTAQNNEEYYPQKVINLLNGLARYNVDNKEYTPELLEQFVDESRKLSQTDSKTDTTRVILNSTITLDDIIGTPMTKAAAQNVVNRIKSGTFKTKGYTISQSNGSAYGGGRFHVAQAIAGEAKIPMFIINSKDFALKEWDAQSQNADFSEMKIKKIVQAAKAQAEANPNKTAMIYIRNFDGFGSNPLYGISSPYEQKAFNQLLEEMENTRKEGKVNLLVMGSVNMPQCIDENIMKPNQFLDTIEIYAPQDEKQTSELFKYYIDKMNIKLKGSSQEEQEKLLKQIAATAEGFNPVEVVYLLETASAVMQEKNHDAMDYYDFIEAYLQTTTGRVNTAQNDYRTKEIVTAHETGHAIIKYVMEEIARKNGVFQELPDKFNFISLDPRTLYAGVTYSTNSENSEMNLSTVMSRLASCYGGYSVEKIMYGMDGSWGISSDAEHISSLAYAAVAQMGMGKRTGVRTMFLDENFIPESKKEAIDKDVDDLCDAAKEISDLIVGTYQGFIKQFSDKYAKYAGTGEGIISRSQFEKDLNEYRNSLSDEEKQKLDDMEKQINAKMHSLKRKV